MTSKDHKKHTALARPAFGTFHRNEWAIVGGPCSLIRKVAGAVIARLLPVYRAAYVDTAHNSGDVELPGMLAQGAALEYTDQLSYRSLNYHVNFNSFALRNTFAGADLVIANGNHHTCKAQIVIISERKRESLQKRLGQLTNVQAFLLADGSTEIFDFIRNALPGWERLPVFALDEVGGLAAFFAAGMQQAVPMLNGLVLAGGESRRMGFDKGSINWHGKEQRHHLADMLSRVCNEVYISHRTAQQGDKDDVYPVLADTFVGLGPYGAILSAFRERPDEAWLVVASDLPLMDDETLRRLAEGRTPSSIATAYNSSQNEFPEPLIAIWEPKSYPVLLSFLAQGYSCPRKVLINSEVTLLTASNPDALTNVNTPEEYERVKAILDQNIPAE